MLSLGESHGRKLQYMGGVDIGGEDGIDELEQQLAWLCTDDPYLKYLHFNANRGTTSFQDCSRVAESPTDRCTLQGSNGGRSEIQSTDGATSAFLLSDACRLSCGLCPTDILDHSEVDVSPKICI